MPVTIMDIARKVGVTKQTVSLVLNKKDSPIQISARTRDRVMQAVKELNYQPNYLARNLKSQRSYFIGVLCPEGLYTSEDFYINRLHFLLILF